MLKTYHGSCHCGADALGDYVSVKVLALDDAPLDEILAAPVHYANGRDNAWGDPPAETRHL